MTPEELSALLADVVDPDKAAGAVADLNEKVTAMIQDAADSKQKATEYETRIEELQKTAMALARKGLATAPAPAPVDDGPHVETDEAFNARLKAEFLDGYMY